MKRILVTGATGAMGSPMLQELLKNPAYEVYATSRSPRSDPRIHWLQGDAKEKTFLNEVLRGNSFDAVVDYMVYTTEEFRERCDFLLANCSHYLFTSSARVYAEKNGLIDENAPRILDVCRDETYLSGDTYELAKARQEDILKSSGRKNWTIVRPSLTYNKRRLQFAIFELKEWIYRPLCHNSVIFPAQMRDTVTTMTYGDDVAGVVSKLVLNPDVMGETFNVSGGGHSTWGKILEIYRPAIEAACGEPMRVREVGAAEEIARHLRRYEQYRYARGIDRIFSNEKVEAVVGHYNYTSMEEGLSNCMRAFLEKPDELIIGARKAAYLDRLVGETTPLSKFPATKQKAVYLLGRYGIIRV